MQIVFQDPFGSLSPRLSVFHIIAEGLRVHNMGDSDHKRRDLVAEIMDEVGLEPEMMDRFPHEFSGGQRQRMANELVVMKDGIVVEHGATETVFANPQTDYTRELITAAFDIDVVERKTRVI